MRHWQQGNSRICYWLRTWKSRRHAKRHLIHIYCRKYRFPYWYTIPFDCCHTCIWERKWPAPCLFPIYRQPCLRSLLICCRYLSSTICWPQKLPLVRRNASLCFSHIAAVLHIPNCFLPGCWFPCVPFPIARTRYPNPRACPDPWNTGDKRRWYWTWGLSISYSWSRYYHWVHYTDCWYWPDRLLPGGS